MKKKRRSRQYKHTSRVINMEEARKARQEKRQAERETLEAEGELTQRQLKRKKAIRFKQIRRRLFIIAIIVVIAGFATKAVFDIVKLKMELNKQLETQQQLEEQKEELQEKAKDVDSDKTLEDQARDKLKMIKPGEKVYVPEDGENDKN